MNVRMKCNTCGKQTELYGAFPHCRECGEIVCPDCGVPGEEDEERGRTLCKKCAADMDTEFVANVATLATLLSAPEGAVLDPGEEISDIEQARWSR